MEEPEPEFLLKPHTYSPAPSPKPPYAPSPRSPSPPVQEAAPPPPPEVRKRSSLRQRFSLKRKGSPPEQNLKAPETLSSATYSSPQPRVYSVAVAPIRARESSLNTPPSRGLDSAYCSDFEKTSPPSIPHHPLTQTTSRQSSHAPHASNPSQNHNLLTRESMPKIGRGFVPSPRSDQQFFRPVQASPNSPLQRPWTAGPTNPLHVHSNSSTSNLSTHSRNNYHTHTPSQLGNRHMAPSAMGMSVISDMTMMTEVGENGESKKVKKKRSAFGWLKKAFSLSEEEKAAFEQKRRMQDREQEAYYQRERAPPRYLDGRRIR